VDRWEDRPMDRQAEERADGQMGRWADVKNDR